MKRPASQYYWGDWRRDTALQACSLAARGLWHEMNCLMHDCEPYGHLCVGPSAMQPAQLARLVGVAPKACMALIAELEAAGVFSRTPEGVIYSRRMVRDEDLRNRRAEGGKGGSEHGAKGAQHGSKGGRPPKNNPPQTDAEGGFITPLDPSNKPPPAFASASASASASSSEDKGGIAVVAGQTPNPVPAEPPPGSEPAADAAPTPKGRRLPADWELPKAWGEAALAEFPLWTADKVRLEGRKFRDHWVAKPGKDATKTDWQATWRNWCRSDIAHRDDPKPGGSRMPPATAIDTATRNAEAKRLLGFAPAEGTAIATEEPHHA
jgi:hypothetical protein